MQRETFLRLTGMATIACCLPGLSCSRNKNSFQEMLAHPSALEHVCDSKTLQEIGKAYQKTNETGRAALVQILSTDNRGRAISESMDSASVASLLSEKVEEDFRQGRTVIVDGWVLSITEARQCALLSIVEK